MTLTTPLLCQTVGFDRFNDIFEILQNEALGSKRNLPPYNIEKQKDDTFRIIMAIAGFTKDDLSILLHDGELKITGKIETSEEDKNVQILHRGIANRSFQHAFRIADYIRVEDAQIKDGLLTINLACKVPKEKKPRMIEIRNGSTNKLVGQKKN